MLVITLELQNKQQRRVLSPSFSLKHTEGCSSVRPSERGPPAERGRCPFTPERVLGGGSQGSPAPPPREGGRGLPLLTDADTTVTYDHNPQSSFQYFCRFYRFQQSQEACGSANWGRPQGGASRLPGFPGRRPLLSPKCGSPAPSGAARPQPGSRAQPPPGPQTDTPAPRRDPDAGKRRALLK